jgi:hypothetical protein
MLLKHALHILGYLSTLPENNLPLKNCPAADDVKFRKKEYLRALVSAVAAIIAFLLTSRPT